MNKNFNKGLLLTSFGSFWWGFIGVIYFQYVSFIGHIELVVHRCLWTAVMLIFTTSFLSKWSIFLKEIKDTKKLFAFVSKHIDSMEISSLLNLDKFLNINDEDLYKFYNGSEVNLKFEDDNILSLFKNFEFNKK